MKVLSIVIPLSLSTMDRPQRKDKPPKEPVTNAAQGAKDPHPAQTATFFYKNNINPL